jgi:tetratricopeptide (TPR) repeat protein
MSEHHQSNDPWHLISAHQYEKAVADYDAILAAGEDYYAIVANRAIALLCLGRLSEALEGFVTANDIARQDRGAPKSAPYLSNMGTVLWLMGHRSVAKELYRSAADGIRYGTIAYTDASGGAGEGLLLWYAGLTTKDRNATEYALDYLTRLAKKSRIKNWPGPLAQFVLERQSFNGVLRDSFKTDNLLETAEQAKSDILKRRELVQALFVFGTKCRQRGDKDGCRRAFQQCAQLENPHVEQEWYLAAAEVELFPPKARRSNKSAIRRQRR